MKTIYFLLNIWFCITATTIYGQSPVQMKYGNEMYNVNKWVAYSGADTTIAIANCNNSLNMDKLVDRCNCDTWTYDAASLLPKVLKSVFSPEKQKALAATVKMKRITCTLYLDAVTGQILDVDFKLIGASLSAKEESDTAVTLKEIYQLETQFKAQRLRTDYCNCSKYKYGYIAMTVPLNRLSALR